MEYITLAHSDLLVSRLCMGGCPMGRYGWGTVLEDELIAAVHTALDEGITFFDTADTYGLGQSEITLGKALGARRKDVTVASKFGVRVKDSCTVYDNSPAWIKEACEASLKRLGTDYIDLYQIHYRDDRTPLAEVVDALRQLKKEGKIRYFALCNIHREHIDELRPLASEFVSFQDEYSLACRKNEQDMLLLSDTCGLSPLTWGSLGQGILTGKYTLDNVDFGKDDRRSRDIYVNFHGEKLQKNLQIVEVMKQIAARRGKKVSAVAIRFILDHIPGSVVLCGAKRPDQITDNVQGADWHLSAEELNELDKISLL